MFFFCMFYNVISNELPDKMKIKIVCTQTYKTEMKLKKIKDYDIVQM